MLLWVLATVSRRESSSMGGDHSEERSERGWELVSRSQSTSHPQGGPKGVFAASQSVSTLTYLARPFPNIPWVLFMLIPCLFHAYPVHLSCSLFSLFEKAVANSDHGFAMKITKGHAVPYHVRMWPSRATPMCDQVGRRKAAVTIWILFMQIHASHGLHSQPHWKWAKIIRNPSTFMVKHI